jgi:hypothetical protein
MAQLIKVCDCVSRYQNGMLRYASRFIRLKSRRTREWEDRQKDIGTFLETEHQHENRQEFENWLFRMQLDWATRTAERRSICPVEIEDAGWVRKLLLQVNDLSFLAYRPVLLTKSGAVQLDSLLITNDVIWCVLSLPGEAGSVFQEISGRKWREIINGGEREVLSPLISLKRTRTVIDAFLKQEGMAVKTVSAVLAPHSFIEFVPDDTGAVLVDQRRMRDWLDEISSHSLMLKKAQIHVADTLLAHFETVDAPRFQT